MAKPTELIASNVSYVIGQTNILHNINMTLARGQVLGVLGPNGAGKTTLLKILSGQVASQNCVSWQGTHIENFSPIELAKQIAVVNQLNDSVHALSLQRIVAMGLLPHKSLLSQYSQDDEQVVEKAIKTVGLWQRKYQAFEALSGGEQQRSLIARAMVQQAPLLILDEPVNHLDVYYQHQILSLLRSLASQYNMTIVLSLHDLNLAAHYCDQLSLLNNGQMVAQGLPEDVMQAEILEHTFRLPCQVSVHASSNKPRVDFIPPSHSKSAIKS